MSEMTAEEQLASELINYIECEPDHFAGLCHYFNYGPAVETIQGYSYQLFQAAMHPQVWQGELSYYMAHLYPGPIPKRLAFAAHVLNLVTSGKLVFLRESNRWQVTLPDGTTHQ